MRTHDEMEFPKEENAMRVLICFFLWMLVFLAIAADSTFAQYSGGSGTEIDPYIIATKADLLALAANTADYDKYFILTADIDMKGQVFTTAIIAPDTITDNDSFDGIPFTGTFNGNGCKITHFTINGSSLIGHNHSYLGLFGCVGDSGWVRNLGLENFTVSDAEHSYSNTSGADYIGGLVGWNFGGDITNCYSSGKVNGLEYVGGLVGYNSGIVFSCCSSGTVEGSEYVGGLAGYNAGSIAYCYSTAAVGSSQLHSGVSYVGGLVGWNAGNISCCNSSGTVSGYDYAGGLVGYNENHIGSCYSISRVSGNRYVGGLAGWSSNGIIEYCYSTGIVSAFYCYGGLLGYNSGSTSYSFSKAAVTGDSGFEQYVGGLVGYNDGTIWICYNINSVSLGASRKQYYVGGFAGYNSGTILMSFSMSQACGYYYIGGFAGYNSGSISDCYSMSKAAGLWYIGGLVGWNYSNGSISNCYSTGSAVGDSPYAGGLVGWNTGIVSGSFWDTQTSGEEVGVGSGTSSGVTGKTTAEMMTLSTFADAGWDVNSIWLINEGNDYPRFFQGPVFDQQTNRLNQFGYLNKKNIKLTLKDCNDNDVTFSLTGGGFGEVNNTDCNFPVITLFETTDKSALTISTKSRILTSIGSIICGGPVKSITAKTATLSGNITIHASLNPPAAASITFDRADNLTIDSQIPIKSVTASEWLGGSINAPSVGSIAIKGDTKRGISGDLNNVELTLRQVPDVKTPALGKLTVKGWIDSSQILSQGNIGTVTAGAVIDSNCFAGVADGITGLPAAEAASFPSIATIKSITIKGIKTELSPYYINSNIAAANILSASVVYPQSDNGGVPFGMSADYIKKLTIKKTDGKSVSLKELKESKDSQTIDGVQIRLY